MKYLKKTIYFITAIVTLSACTPISLEEELEKTSIEQPLATGDEDQTVDQTEKD
jgi:hypothetical protein